MGPEPVLEIPDAHPSPSRAFLSYYKTSQPQERERISPSFASTLARACRLRNYKTRTSECGHRSKIKITRPSSLNLLLLFNPLLTGFGEGGFPGAVKLAFLSVLSD